MIIIVKSIARRWHLLHPEDRAMRVFDDGADAFDAAAALACTHYHATGEAAAVRVQAFDAHVEAFRIG